MAFIILVFRIRMSEHSMAPMAKHIKNHVVITLKYFRVICISHPFLTFIDFFRIFLSLPLCFPPRCTLNRFCLAWKKFRYGKSLKCFTILGISADEFDAWAWLYQFVCVCVYLNVISNWLCWSNHFNYRLNACLIVTKSSELRFSIEKLWHRRCRRWKTTQKWINMSKTRPTNAVDTLNISSHAFDCRKNNNRNKRAHSKYMNFSLTFHSDSVNSTGDLIKIKITIFGAQFWGNCLWTWWLCGTWDTQTRTTKVRFSKLKSKSIVRMYN